MFHVLGRVYLVPREQFTFGVDCIQCYAHPGQMVGYDSETGKLLTATVSKRLALANNLSELREQTQSDQGLIDTLESYLDKDLHIYVDAPSHNEIVLTLWKTIFPDLSNEIAWSMYCLFRTKELVSSKNSWIDELTNVRMDVAGIYWGLKQDQFNELFDSVKPLDAKIKKSSLSIEYLLADKLAGSKDIAALKEKVLSLYDKELAQDILHYKFEIEDCILKAHEFLDGAPVQEPKNFSLEVLFKARPELKNFFHPAFPKMKSLSDITKVMKQKDLFKIFEEYSAWDTNPYNSEYLLQAFIKNGCKRLSFDEIMEKHIVVPEGKGENISHLLCRLNHRRKANVLLVEYLYSLKDEKNDIQQFKIT